MNEIEKKYFGELHQDRSDSADTFEKPSTREMWRSIVEKYTDQAHFVYELIQNADDTGATKARFILESDRLIFAHNGSRHFSISNPATEDIDSKRGTLGDINSITGIAFSNKKTQQNKIGKFGVGFKAVFQYTATPHIYDPATRFKISRYIVPTELKEDFPGRKPDETLFVFPFDHKDRNPRETYRDIEAKLKALSSPILFLSNLVEIKFTIGNYSGLYTKRIEKSVKKNDTICERISLVQNKDTSSTIKSMWLFSRLYSDLRYSVGFYLNAKNELVPVTEPAYCYFPTKETTGLRFIIHAPFLLNDSREGIRAGIAHNNDMIKLLANLAGDSLSYLKEIGEEEGNRYIKDNIVSIIPINRHAFAELSDTSRISFLPFYNRILNAFKTSEIIPTTDGYTSSSSAYWASVSNLTKLFSNEQLASLVGKKSAYWAFPSYSRDEVQRNNERLFEYIEEITSNFLNDEHVIRGRFSGYGYSRRKEMPGITASFIENQTEEWLHQLYKWLSETSRRTDMAKTAPIFLDQDGKGAAAFDDKEHLILFLPTPGVDGYRIVHPDLLKVAETKAFVKKIGIQQPSIRDQIYNFILPEYKSSKAMDTNPHFVLFFKYYCECPQGEVNDFISEIKEYPFLNCYHATEGKMYRSKADQLYCPTEDLKKYFESKPTTWFVAYDDYLDLVGESKKKELDNFLYSLGVRKNIRILEKTLDFHERYSRNDLPHPYSTSSTTYTEPIIDGCQEIIDYIKNNKSVEKSVLLWQQLLKMIKSRGGWNFSYALRGTCRYFYYTHKSMSFTSISVTTLKEEKWIVNREGSFCSASELYTSTLSDRYDLQSEEVAELLSFLGIEDEPEPEIEEEDDSNLSERQREQISIAKLCDELGLTEEDLRALAAEKKRKEELLNHPDYSGGSVETDSYHKNPDIDDVFDDDDDEEYESPATDDSEKETKIPKLKIPKATSKVAKDIIKRTQGALKENGYENNFDAEWDDDVDSDEYTPSPVDFSKKAEQEKQKAARAIDKIVHQEELQQRALDAKKYSYGWFKALLELEALNSNANNLNSKEISISFAKVEREPGTQRTLILKHPNRYIPQFMEDLADIPLVIKMGEQSKTLAIEVANVKSYTLRVKLKSHVDISEIDFSKVTEARIDAQSPVFLLEELRKKFGKLEYDDDFDMQEKLCPNIDFVFGPPGTGKTTYLAKNVLTPLMQEKRDLKVLVLTPTNKAADVLVKRIMEIMGKDHSYENWMVRFGGTGDEEIENSPVYREKTFDIRGLKRSVTITTIARFPYDFFMPQGTRLYLNAINWDYIVIDEASMIPLVNIIYPLYKKTPEKFIIAGDPFQIEPITSVDLWKNENIYTMVKLDSFVNPDTVPHKYDIKLLTTQYRSVPSVGRIFSQFTYGGILEHYRNEESRRKLNIESTLPVNTLNIIKYPVSKYESIYRAKRLQKSSSYQVYSALFVYEFVSYLSRLISNANPNQQYRIGIIAPYRAQSDLIEKLIGAEDIPKQIDVQVGTIHGFQGDECDIIFAVFNTPPSISSSKEMFLNKRNIINVSISRAKDYLFIIMPDDNTENIQNLRLVNRVEQLCKGSDSCTTFDSHALEKAMFNSSTYLEDNAFSTGHQSVNVYGLPEKRYEIRTEDSAVDVQVHNPIENTRNNQNQNEDRLTEKVTGANISTQPDTASVEPVHFHWLKTKTKVCPVDQGTLQVNAVPVLRKDGVQKKLNMRVCQNCGRRFIVENALASSVNLSDYNVIGDKMPVKHENQPRTNSALSGSMTNSGSSKSTNGTNIKVYNKNHGNGTIIARENRNGRKIIVVRFSNATIKYDEESAFSSGSLTLKY